LREWGAAARALSACGHGHPTHCDTLLRL